MTERKAIRYNLIAGVLFALLALHALTGYKLFRYSLQLIPD